MYNPIIEEDETVRYESKMVSVNAMNVKFMVGHKFHNRRFKLALEGTLVPLGINDARLAAILKEGGEKKEGIGNKRRK